MILLLSEKSIVKKSSLVIGYNCFQAQVAWWQGKTNSSLVTNVLSFSTEKDSDESSWERERERERESVCVCVWERQPNMRVDLRVCVWECPWCGVKILVRKLAFQGKQYCRGLEFWTLSLEWFFKREKIHVDLLCDDTDWSTMLSIFVLDKIFHGFIVRIQNITFCTCTFVDFDH